MKMLNVQMARRILFPLISVAQKYELASSSSFFRSFRNLEDGDLGRVVRTQRFVIITVDIHSQHISSLYEHIVESSRNSSCAHGIRVLGVPSDENGVAVRVG